MADTKFHLYRSCRKRDWGKRKTSDDLRTEKFLSVDGKNSLHPNYGYTKKDGSFRPPDVTLFNKAGEVWIRGVEDVKSDGKHWVSWKEGVSISKNKEVMPYSGGWFDFLLPEGTAIPASLDVKHTPSKSDPDHYSIRLKNQMSQEAYHGALDNLARNAIAKSVKLSIPLLYFS